MRDKKRLTELLGSIRARMENLAGGQAATREPLRVVNDTSTPAVYIYNRIGGWDGVYAEDVAAALKGLGDVNVHINSKGGDIFEGAAIHNLLRNHNGNVEVRIDGVAASAASFIAMAADKIVMESNATMMIHDVSALCICNAQDMRDSADVLDLLSDTIAAMYAEKAGGEASEWRDKMRAETWYNATQALEAGLVDEVPAARGASNGLDLSVFDYLTRPAAPAATATNEAPKTERVEGFAAMLKEALA